MQSRRDFLRAAGLAATWPVARGVVGAAAKERRPNFLWILSEDNSKHYLRLLDPHGAPAPAIERLAKDGVVFARAFSNAPVCSVARTTLMSGTLAPRIGTQYHRKMKLANLPPGLRMWPFYLRQAGYYTSNNRKKDYNCVEGKGVWDESSGKASWRKRPSKDKPFFHMQSTGVSHEGRLHFGKDQIKRGGTHADPEKVFVAPYHPDTPTFRFTCARYHDCMAAVDQQVKQLVGQLEQDGLLDDTFVFYFGDHGGVLPRGKGYIYESGLHVPLVVRIPKNFQHLVTLKPGSRTNGFVSFVDFGPTLLHLAGLKIPKQMDGKAFLGDDISAEALAARDETFGYADRFDEKYDLCRSLRKGRFKYLRSYQAFYPDGLQNNYRYRMLAYEEWRTLFKAGKLNAAQRQFHERKPVEALYDIETDPHEVEDLSGDPKYAATLADLRGRLQARVKGLPDLSFYPESHLIDNALTDGAAFGQKHKAEIGRLVDVADLSLLPFDKARPGIDKALASRNRWERYWALIVCSCFGEKAKAMVPAAKERLKDEEPLVKVRAAEFLAIVGAADPRPTFYEVLNGSPSTAVALLTFNTVVYVNDCLEGYPFDMKQLKVGKPRGEVGRRTGYLAGKESR
ncbi:MAG: sulfatase [Candidatus Brocadiae bacterium]|nr:sulfatase [Candidatus Brocadiia bacterium]